MMNKIFILMVTTISLIMASPSMAVDVLSPPEFFYGESVENNIGVDRLSGVRNKADVATNAQVLSTSEFFYGDMTTSQVVLVESSDMQEVSRMTTPANAQLTPGVFFGYQDDHTSGDANPSNVTALDGNCNCPACIHC